MPIPRTSFWLRLASGYQFCESGRDPVEHDVRTLRDVEVRRQLLERLAGEVADGEPGVRRPQVGNEHDPGIRIEPEDRRRAATGRWTLPHLAHEVVGDEEVDTLGNGGAGQAGHAGQLGTGRGFTPPDEAQHLSG